MSERERDTCMGVVQCQDRLCFFFCCVEESGVQERVLTGDLAKYGAFFRKVCM